MDNDLFCKIFIDTDEEYDKIFSLVEMCVGGKHEAISYIVTEWCDISVQRNKEYSNQKYMLDSSDFLYWKFYLDIEPHDVDGEEYIIKIEKLINSLRKKCKNIIVACDFEDDINYF